MPSLRARSVPIGTTYERAQPPQHAPSAGPVHMMPAPTSPHLMRSRWMLTALPSIAQSGDGGVRQFYSNRNLPTFKIPVL